MPSERLTQSFVDKKATAEPGADRSFYWDETRPGFGLMVTAAGHRSYVVQYRANGQSRRYTIDGLPPLKEARKIAAKLQGQIAAGGDPVAEERATKVLAANSLQSVAERFLAAPDGGKKLRVLNERTAEFRRYIYPQLGSRPVDSVRRSEIVKLLDNVEERNGPGAAQKALVALSRLFNWYAIRSDDFRSPIIRGMGRLNTRERARERTLSDDELRLVWRAAENAPEGGQRIYGCLLRYIFLTATRRREASDMNWRELSADGAEWIISAARYKTKRDHLVPLSPTAREVLRELPPRGDGMPDEGWVFTTIGSAPIGGFSKFKRQFDARVLEEARKLDPKAEPLPQWTIHDLRRTARSLMARAGVPDEHAEVALGHVKGGVVGTYNRYEYFTEKRVAFEALAGMVARILHPKANVAQLKERARSRTRPKRPPAR